jgi:hypothetical protein
MHFFFGYIYYRTARHFLSMGRKSGEAGSMLALIQVLLAFWIIRPLEKLLFSSEYPSLHPNTNVFLGLLLFPVLAVMNLWIHDEKYDEYNRRWGNEDFKVRTLKGILVIVFLMSPLLSLWWLQYQPWF